MARTDYGPEVKKAIDQHGKKSPPKPSAGKKNEPGDTPADMARDRQRGIPEDSPQDVRIDARNAANTAPPRVQPHAPMLPGAGPQMAGPPDAHHVAAAAGIAHAILGSRSGGY